jgi:hypothetical protein
MTQDVTYKLLDAFQVSPHFTNLLLGHYTANHLPPADFQTFDREGNLQKIGMPTKRNHNRAVSIW